MLIKLNQDQWELRERISIFCNAHGQAGIIRWENIASSSRARHVSLKVQKCGNDENVTVIIQWNLDITDLRYNEVLGITNDFVYPSSCKIYGKEPRCNENKYCQSLGTSLYRGSTVLTVLYSFGCTWQQMMHVARKEEKSKKLTLFSFDRELHHTLKCQKCHPCKEKLQRLITKFGKSCMERTKSRACHWISATLIAQPIDLHCKFSRQLFTNHVYAKGVLERHVTRMKSCSSWMLVCLVGDEVYEEKKLPMLSKLFSFGHRKAGKKHSDAET